MLAVAFAQPIRSLLPTAAGRRTQNAASSTGEGPRPWTKQGFGSRKVARQKLGDQNCRLVHRRAMKPVDEAGFSVPQPKRGIETAVSSTQEAPGRWTRQGFRSWRGAPKDLKTPEDPKPRRSPQLRGDQGGFRSRRTPKGPDEDPKWGRAPQDARSAWGSTGFSVLALKPAFGLAPIVALSKGHAPRPLSY